MASTLAVVGLVLSVIGAALDFTSGTLILQTPSIMPVASGMGMAPMNTGAITWGLLLYGLGGPLIVTGVLGVTRVGMGRMHIFGGLMVIYGIIMLLIGGSMFMGVTPMMEGALFSSVGMFAVGLGMMVNGLLMATRREMMMSSM